MRRYPLNTQQSQDYAGSTALILPGFTVAPDHSIVLCEQGRENTYSRKRPEQRVPRTERARSILCP